MDPTLDLSHKAEKRLTVDPNIMQWDGQIARNGAAGRYCSLTSYTLHNRTLSGEVFYTHVYSRLLTTFGRWVVVAHKSTADEWKDKVWCTHRMEGHLDEM